MPLQPNDEAPDVRLGVGALAQTTRPAADSRGVGGTFAEQRATDEIVRRREGLSMAQILHFTDLQRICAPDGPPPTPATVERWADAQGILYKYDRRGRIWTTVEAINAALGLPGASALPHETTLLELV